MSSTELVKNPIPILQQKKADMTTNKFLNEYATKDKQEVKNSKYTIGFTKFNKEFSNSIMEFFDDIYEKPEDKKWQEHIVYIIKKENRHNYLGVLLIFTVMFLILIN